jgi:GNAT superfamily N-acetyltransferase
MPVQRQFIHRFSAENGLAIRVRAMWPTDAPYLVDIFEHMSAQSRYLRFNLPLQDPDPDWVREQAERLSYLRPYEGRAWLAFADLPEQPEAPVGGVRYVAVSHDSAEVALAVRDDLQGLGIGTNLLEFAARKAYSEGYRKLTGVIHSTNLPLWRSLKRLGVPIKTVRDGSTTILEVDLEAAELFRWRIPPQDDDTDQHYDK